MKRSKAYKNSLGLYEKAKKYSVTEACELVKKTATLKYDAQIRVSFKLNVDPRHAEQQIRGAMVLPSGTGRTQKVLVVTQGPKMEEAKAAGADYVGDKEILEKVKGGWFDFDVIIATPEMMGELGKMGRVLGPKGLMPNPKTGTVTMDVKTAVADIKRGKIAYRVDRHGNLCLGIGRVSFDEAKLVENLTAITDAIVKSRPSTVKGTFILNCVVSSTMGPAIAITFPGRN